MKSLSRLALPFILVVGLFPGHAGAVSSAWEETDGGRMRVVIGAADAESGTARGFLDIALKPGWKTYWLEPGSSGIPPMISVDGSLNVDAVEMRLPLPHWIESDAGNYSGYKAPVRFPLIFRLSDGAAKGMAKTSVFVGICEEICIPATAEFVLPISASAAPEADDIDAAFATLPGNELAVVSSMEETDGSVIVTLRHPPLNGNEPTLFAADHAFRTALSHPELVSAQDEQSRFRLRLAHGSKQAKQIKTVLTFSGGGTGQETVHTLSFPATE